MVKISYDYQFKKSSEIIPILLIIFDWERLEKGTFINVFHC